MNLVSVPRWIRFGVVGIIGFFVDASVLYFGVRFLGFNPITARVVSFGCAVWVTWNLNKNFTFNASKVKSGFRQLFSYVLVGGIGFLLNFLFYSCFVLFIPLAWRYPLFALVLSSLVAATFNYFGARFVFLRVPPDRVS